jgi:hypothetical protein
VGSCLRSSLGIVVLKERVNVVRLLAVGAVFTGIVLLRRP